MKQHCFKYDDGDDMVTNLSVLGLALALAPAARHTTATPFAAGLVLLGPAAATTATVAALGLGSLGLPAAMAAAKCGLALLGSSVETISRASG